MLWILGCECENANLQFGYAVSGRGHERDSEKFNSVFPYF